MARESDKPENKIFISDSSWSAILSDKVENRTCISESRWSAVFLEPGEMFSDKEYSGCFLVVTSNASNKTKPGADDTDIEADDGFKEYSEVTYDDKFNKPEKQNKYFKKSKQPDNNTEAVSNNSKPPVCHYPVKCTTGCASTYRKHRSWRKVLSAYREDSLYKNSSSDESSIDSPARKRKKNKTKFGSARVLENNLIEGTFKHGGSIGYERYLGAIGTGRYTQDLVMRAGTVLRIQKEHDKQWRISTETLIKAKSLRGYRTMNRKWTENKFKEGESKPETLDDWDPREVVTTLEVNRKGTLLTLSQEAKKNKLFAKDSVVELELDEEEPNTLIMTCTVQGCVAWRKFERQTSSSKFSEQKLSSRNCMF